MITKEMLEQLLSIQELPHYDDVFSIEHRCSFIKNFGIFGLPTKESLRRCLCW